MSEGTDWAWCYENPKEAASLIDALETERDAYKAQANLLEHKVITCGVAASHSDANLAHTGAYASKWDSPQAMQVRALRAERDALRKDAERYRWLRESGAKYGCIDWGIVSCAKGNCPNVSAESKPAEPRRYQD